MLLLFQFEECPFCAKVRTKLTGLALDFVAINVPKGTDKRSIVEEIGGKNMVPLLIDTDKAVVMYESDDIVEFLEENYS